MGVKGLGLESCGLWFRFVGCGFKVFIKDRLFEVGSYVMATGMPGICVLGGLHQTQLPHTSRI